MISVQHITELVIEAITGTDIFLVDLKVTPDNKITIYLDNSTRITIGECANVSRYVEEKLNREVEDFELTVSSPGLDEPFKHILQYKKRIGNQVAVVTKEGQKVVGKLNNVDDNGISIEQKSKEKTEGKKGRQVIINNVNLMFNQIKETKLVLTF
ncbi:MAG: ribosome assembly cofactor RimP [Bacteroidetes bacterium]|nr:ribosome assembly cofactor RimP [Bacteroidota bacterium]